MQYRIWNKLGEKVSLLGTGTMRLPITDTGKVDEAASIAILRRSIDRGVNYVDTAWMYHDGQSEVVVGKALQDGYREKVFLADKMPVWYAKTREEMRQLFETQLERCQTHCFDMYLLHSVDKAVWKWAKKLKALEFLEEMKEAGKIRYLGFSYHGEADFFPEVADAHDWDFCQIQLNYMDAEFQAGVKGLRYAAKKGLPVVIMEPLKGGRLTDRLPAQVETLWAGAKARRSPAHWAFQWVANFPEVSTILSGMSSLAQLEENLRILEEVQANSLTREELEMIRSVANAYNRLLPYDCTDCKYCLPCPQKIGIPTIIRFYNEWFLYEQNPKIKEAYPLWVPKGRGGTDCVDCKACEAHCPQKLPISEIMKKAAAIFE